VANVLEFRAGGLTLSTLRRIHEQSIVLELSAHDRGRIAVASSLVDKIIAAGDAAYFPPFTHGTWIVHETLRKTYVVWRHTASV